MKPSSQNALNSSAVKCQWYVQALERDGFDALTVVPRVLAHACGSWRGDHRPHCVVAARKSWRCVVRLLTVVHLPLSSGRDSTRRSRRRCTHRRVAPAVAVACHRTRVAQRTALGDTRHPCLPSMVGCRRHIHPLPRAPGSRSTGLVRSRHRLRRPTEVALCWGHRPRQTVADRRPLCRPSSSPTMTSTRH